MYLPPKTSKEILHEHGIDRPPADSLLLEETALHLMETGKLPAPVASPEGVMVIGGLQNALDRTILDPSGQRTDVRRTSLGG